MKSFKKKVLFKLTNFNMKHFGIITVRTQSSRLKEKCLLKIDDYSIIEICIIKCLKANIIPIICTTKNKTDDILEKISKKFNIKCYRGSEKNKIKRWFDCAKKLNLKKFHTIDADDPFFDPKAIKNSLELLKFYDLILPSTISRNGCASEGYSFKMKSIEKLYISLFDFKFKNIDKLDTEMIDFFLKRLQIKKKIFSGMKYQLKKQIRLTLDFKKDYDLFKKISKKISIFAERKDINKFLKNNYKLSIENFYLNKKWEKKQKKFETPRLK